MPTIETNWPDFLRSNIASRRKAQATLRRARQRGIQFTMEDLIWVFS